MNAGPSNDGYRICSNCGYVHLGSSEDKTSHHRPYAIDRQKVNIYARQLVNIQLEKLIEECDEEIDADKRKTLQQKVEKFQENFENNVVAKSDKLWEETQTTCTGQITKLENETKIT